MENNEVFRDSDQDTPYNNQVQQLANNIQLPGDINDHPENVGHIQNSIDREKEIFDVIDNGNPNIIHCYASYLAKVFRDKESFLREMWELWKKDQLEAPVPSPSDNKVNLDAEGKMTARTQGSHSKKPQSISIYLKLDYEYKIKCILKSIFRIPKSSLLLQILVIILAVSVVDAHSAHRRHRSDRSVAKNNEDVWFKPSVNCSNNPCPTGLLFYYECCGQTDCCVRIQVIPAYFGAFAVLCSISLMCCLCCWICCCRDTGAHVEKARRKSTIESLSQPLFFVRGIYRVIIKKEGYNDISPTSSINSYTQPIDNPNDIASNSSTTSNSSGCSNNSDEPLLKVKLTYP